MDKITFIRKQKEEVSDLQHVQSLFDHLISEDIGLDSEKAFWVIHHLQESIPVFPDRFEICNNCEQLFDSYEQGYYSEKRGIHLCYMCDDGED